jgi:Fe-S cluster biosynthesis and repair protein YggX
MQGGGRGASVPDSGANPTAGAASSGYKVYASPAERCPLPSLLFPTVSGDTQKRPTKIVMCITTVEVGIRTVRSQLGRRQREPRASYHAGMDDCAPAPNQQPAGNKSGRTVQCVKFGKEMPGLDSAPWPGELGQRIFENVSAQAWKLWEERQKMILNEYRLMPWQKEAQELMARHMEDFFFGESAALPPGYVPQQTK